MSQAPAMPVFPDALIADTTRLSAEEFGCYCLILMATWRNNGKPFDDNPQDLARICRTTPSRWTSKIRERLAPFFDLSSGKWRQGRLEREWDFVQQKIEIQRSKGRSGAHVRWSGLPDSKEGKRRRREREQSAKLESSHTEEEWQAALEVYGSCLACGRSDQPLTKDHVVPLSKGGHDGIENLQPLCFDCNSKKGASSDDFREPNALELLRSKIAGASVCHCQDDSIQSQSHSHSQVKNLNGISGLPRASARAGSPGIRDASALSPAERRERWQHRMMQEAHATMTPDKVSALWLALLEDPVPPWAKAELERIDRQIKRKRAAA